jgi:hypothetical protein
MRTFLLFFLTLTSVGVFGQRPIPQSWRDTTTFKNPWIGIHRVSGADTLRRRLTVEWIADSAKNTVTVRTYTKGVATSDSVYHYDSTARWNARYHTDIAPDGIRYYISSPARFIDRYPWIGAGTIVIIYPDKHRTIYNH